MLQFPEMLDNVAIVLFLSSICPTSGKIPLTLAGFASIDILDGGWSSAGCIPAIEMALADVNKRADILEEYDLGWVMNDTRCLAGNAINIFFQHLQSEPQKIMILGGGCSVATAPVARTAPYFNLVQMSYSTGSGELSQRKMFPTFFRTSASDVALNLPLIYLMKHFGWNRVATIHQMDPLFSVTIDDLHDLFSKNNITLVTSEIFLDEPRSQLNNIKRQDARIIVINAFEKDTRNLFCRVYNMGLYGADYAWLIPGWYNPYWYNVQDTNCSVEELKVPLEYAFSFSDHKKDTSGNVTVSGQTYEQYNERYMKSSGVKQYGYNDYHTVAYDAVWAVALALEKARKVLEDKQVMIKTTGNTTRPKRLEDFSYMDSHLKELLFELVGDTNFHGMSGIVSFEATGDRKAITQIKQIQGNEEVPIAIFYEERKALEFYSDAVVKWHGDGPPLDGMRHIKERVYISLVAFLALSSIATVGVLIAAGFFTFNITYRNCSYIKMSSPRMNNIIVVGGIFTYFAVILFGIDGKIIPLGHMHIMCWVQIWVLAIGFTLAFGAMFAKTWRVHAIFRQTQAPLAVKNKPLQDYHLYIFVAILAMTDIIILVTWLVVDPLRMDVQKLSESVVNSTHVILYEYEECVSKNKMFWLASFYVKDGLLLIFGCFLAYETKNVHVPAMNDSRYIGMCVYNVVVMCVVGVTVSIVIRSKATIAYSFSATSILFCSTGALLLLFIPKIAYLRKHPEERRGSSSIQKQSTMSSTFQHTMKHLTRTRSNSSTDSGLDNVGIATPSADADNESRSRKVADKFHEAAIREWKKVIAQKDEEIAQFEDEINVMKQEMTSHVSNASDEHAHFTVAGCRDALQKVLTRIKKLPELERAEICKYMINYLDADVGFKSKDGSKNTFEIIENETQITYL